MNNTTLLVIAVLVLVAMVAMRNQAEAKTAAEALEVDEFSALRAALLTSPSTPLTVVKVLNDPYAAPEVMKAAAIPEGKRQGLLL